MDEPGAVNPSATAPPGGGFFVRLSRYAANALRYWEPRRLIYNGVLVLVVVLHFGLEWPESRDKVSFDLVLGLFILECSPTSPTAPCTFPICSCSSRASIARGVGAAWSC